MKKKPSIILFAFIVAVISAIVSICLPHQTYVEPVWVKKPWEK